MQSTRDFEAVLADFSHAREMAPVGGDIKIRTARARDYLLYVFSNSLCPPRPQRPELQGYITGGHSAKELIHFIFDFENDTSLHFLYFHCT